MIDPDRGLDDEDFEIEKDEEAKEVIVVKSSDGVKFDIAFSQIRDRSTVGQDVKNICDYLSTIVGDEFVPREIDLDIESTILSKIVYYINNFVQTNFVFDENDSREYTEEFKSYFSNWEVNWLTSVGGVDDLVNCTFAERKSRIDMIRSLLFYSDFLGIISLRNLCLVRILTWYHLYQKNLKLIFTLSALLVPDEFARDKYPGEEYQKQMQIDYRGFTGDLNITKATEDPFWEELDLFEASKK